MDWFRMYGDMPDDPKIGTLTDSQFRTWVELLCAACKAEDEGNTKLTAETINWSLRRDVSCDVTELSQRHLVTVNGDGEYVIKAWAKRQYKTDSSAERTRRYRERKKAKANDGAASQACDVTVTEAKRHSDCIDTDTDKNKETTLSGKPDAEPADLMQAKEAIDYLNEKTNSGFQKVETNLRMVRARLAEGFSIEVVKSVIDRQVDRWGSDPKMAEYLRPKTLFAASNFASYAGQITAKQSDWWTQAGFDSAFDAENHGCNANTAHQWRNRQRVEVPA